MIETTNQPVRGPGNYDCRASHFSRRNQARTFGVFVAERAAQKMRFAGGLFTPCTRAVSLLEALAEAAKCASRGDVVLLSPACSSFDRFRNDQQSGEELCTARKSISRGLPGGNPNGDGRFAERRSPGSPEPEVKLNLSAGFLRENRRTKTEQTYLNERTRHRAISK